ncbi:MAG: 3'-5' exonuclease [Gemmatimonadaceae bacterium]|nr:3'-5' exonuclease [Gemmatimonadaceae bacterium]
MAVSPFQPSASSRGTVVGRRPTTLSARAAECLARGPLDAVTLMREVCQVQRLQRDAAERMALALLASHDEFVQLPTGHWALRAPELEGPDAERWAHDDPAATTSPSPNTTARTLKRRPRDPDQLGFVTADGSPTFAPPAPSTLADVDFAVVDVETTGTRIADRVTEVAIVHVRNGDIVDVFSQLVNPERPIPPHITALTQITWSMVKDQPAFREIAEGVGQRLAGHVFTAHNAAFDWRFLSQEFSRGGVRLGGPRLCTVRLARLLLPQLARRSLDHVTRYFGIEVASRHRAAGDAEATAKALIRMLRIANDEGLGTWPLLEARLAAPRRSKGRTAAERRRRAFPHPMLEDYIA